MCPKYEALFSIHRSPVQLLFGLLNIHYTDSSMPIKDLHSKPFDPGTLSKLELFEHTADGFLSVFIRSGTKPGRRIQIYDFFSGPGYDKNGNEGSSIRLVRNLISLIPQIREYNYDVRVLFNDTDSSKIQQLESSIENFNCDRNVLNFEYKSENFRTVFVKTYQGMRYENAANLIIIDQNGIKHFTPELFKQLRNLKRTDFMVFLSSTYAWRFKGGQEFKKYVDTDVAFKDATSFLDAHRALVDYFKGMVENGEEYYLAPFSIKKNGGNIYGVMFGTSNLLGMQKFLEAAWRIDSQRGEANYDIDSEGMFSLTGELELGWGKVNKVRSFENELSEAILTGTVSSTGEAFEFTLTRGFLPKHANAVTKRLSKEDRIARVTGIGYMALKNPKPIVLL